MEILYEVIKSTQKGFVNFIFGFIFVLVLMFITLIFHKNSEQMGAKNKRQKYIAILALVFVTISILIENINDRINYSIIHIKKVIFSENTKLNLGDEIANYPELKGYKVIGVEGKIYTIELREKVK